MIAAFQSAHTIAVRIKNITLYEGDQHMQMKFTGKWIARLAAGAAALCIGLGGAVQHYALGLPDHFYKDADRPLSIQTAFFLG